MIYLIITASIHNKDGIHNELHRKQRYMQSIQAVLDLVQDIKPIIVENNGPRETYLNTFPCDVVYTTHNSVNFPHKGVNELMDIKHVIQKYNIQEDDMIIKLTGRYRILHRDFIDTVKNHSNVDAFLKFFNVCTYEYMENDCVLGLLAMRCKYWKEFEYQCRHSAEVEIARFVRKQVSNVMEIKELGLQCCFADDLRVLHV